MAETLSNPTLILVTTTATVPEEVVVGDKSKDWKISLLEERVESRIIMTKGLEAKLRNLQANLDAAHRELAGLRSQLATWENAGRDLGAVIATRDETILVRDAMIADLEETNERQNEALHQSRESADESSRHTRILEENLEGRDTYAGMLQADVHVMVNAADDLAGQLSEAKATIASLRTQLARAEAIEAVATKVLKHANREDDYTNTIDAAWLDELEAALTPSPAPAPPEPKCPHCGAGIGPKSLTCGGCGQWLGKPAAKPTDPRLDILERIARHVREGNAAIGGAEISRVYHALNRDLADLDKLEASPCPSR